MMGSGNIKTTDKEFVFGDLNAFTDYAEGYFTEGDKLLPSPSIKATGRLKNGLRCLKIYDVGFIVYYCSDGKLYRKVNGEYIDYKIPAISAPPEIFSLIYGGEKTVAVACESGTYLLNDRISFISMIRGDAYAEYNGTLFIAKGEKIIVCGDAEYNGDEINLNPRTFLYPEGRYGKVIKFVEISRELYAVCKRGAVKITLTGDEMGYSLSDCNLPPFKSIKESVVSTGNEAYFINLNSLYRFNGKRVEKVKSFLDKKTVEVVGEASVKDNYYLIPVNVGGQRKIYCHDVLSGKDSFIEGGGIIMAGGSTASFTTNETGEIDISPSKRIWESVNTDLEFNGKKTLSFLRIKTDSDLAFSIDGDGIKRNFTVKAGEEYVPLFVAAEKFRFKITDETGNPANRISGLTVGFRI